MGTVLLPVLRSEIVMREADLKRSLNVSTTTLANAKVVLFLCVALTCLAGCQSSKTVNDGFGMVFEENSSSVDRVTIK